MVPEQILQNARKKPMLMVYGTVVVHLLLLEAGCLADGTPAEATVP